MMIAGGVLAAGLSRSGTDGGAAGPRAWVPSETDWTQFRHDAQHSGVASSGASMRFAYYKWAVRTGGAVTSSPAVATLRAGSNGTDVVVGSSDGRLYCINGMNGNIRWRYQSGGAIRSSPAIGDIDGDGRPEVVFGSDDGRVHAVRGENGTALWRFTTRSSISGSPALADVNGDMGLDVVVGGLDGNVYALNGNGTRIWAAPTPLGGVYNDTGILASPAVGDVNGDGWPEVVVTAGDWYLYAFKGGDGSVLWKHSLGTPVPLTGQLSSPLLTDLDSDGDVEISVGSSDGTFYCIKGDGSEKWTAPHLGSMYSSPAAGHIDYDNTKELYVCYASSLACLNGATGEIRWARSFGSGIESSPALADVTGEGGLEVVVGANDRIMRALSGIDGAPVWTYPCPKPIRSSPAVADIDRDANAEVVFGCDDGRIYALDYNF